MTPVSANPHEASGSPIWRSEPISPLEQLITAHGQCAPFPRALYESGSLWSQTSAQATAAALKWPRSRSGCSCSRILLGRVLSGKNGTWLNRVPTPRGLFLALTVTRSLLTACSLDASSRRHLHAAQPPRPLARTWAQPSALRLQTWRPPSTHSAASSSIVWPQGRCGGGALSARQGGNSPLSCAPASAPVKSCTRLVNPPPAPPPDAPPCPPQADPGDGLFLSPYGIAQALAMVLNGAEPGGETYRQLQVSR